MKFVYGWGASVVLLGALFKIMHWPGASYMLVAGMGTEVLIFFLSAFEPLHEEVDWTLVYPELAGMTDDFEPGERGGHDGRGAGLHHDNRLLNIAHMPPPKETFYYEQQGTAATPQPVFAGNFSGEGLKGLHAIEQFDNLLAQANLSPEMFQKLGEGIHKVGDIAEKFEGLETSIEATGAFTNNMNNAAKAAEGLTVVCNNSTDILKDSVGNLSESYIRSAELIGQTGDTVSNAVQEGVKTMVGSLNAAGSKLIESMNKSELELRQMYQTMIDELNQTASNVRESSRGYSVNIEAQNKNLSSINSLYELHLQNISQHTKMLEDLYGKGNQMVAGFNEGLEQTLSYRDGLKRLNGQLSQLNEIYGSMLSTVTLNEN